MYNGTGGYGSHPPQHQQQANQRLMMEAQQQQHRHESPHRSNHQRAFFAEQDSNISGVMPGSNRQLKAGPNQAILDAGSATTAYSNPLMAAAMNSSSFNGAEASAMQQQILMQTLSGSNSAPGLRNDMYTANQVSNAMGHMAGHMNNMFPASNPNQASSINNSQVGSPTGNYNSGSGYAYDYTTISTKTNSSGRLHQNTSSMYHEWSNSTNYSESSQNSGISGPNLNQINGSNVIIQPHAHARQAAQVARQTYKQQNQSSNAGSQNNKSTLIDEVNLGSNSNVNPSVNPSDTGSSKPQSLPSTSTAVIRKHQALAEEFVNNYSYNALITGSVAKEPFPDWSMMDLGGTLIHSVSPTLFSYYQFLTVLYLNHNQLFQIPSAIRKLSNLVVLDVSHNRLQNLPVEIGQLSQLRELWLFDNLLEDIPWEVALCHQLEFIGLEGNPIMKLNPYHNMNTAMLADPVLSELLRNMKYEHPVAEMLFRTGAVGLLKWLRDQMPVEVLVPYPVPQRKWIRKLPSASNTISGSESKIRFLSYNILCDRYATTQQYWYTPQWALDVSYRRQLVLSEILSHDADVICLQEIDTVQYEEFWLPRLCGSKKSWIPADQLKENDEDYDENSDSEIYHSAFLPKSRYKTMSEKARKSAQTAVDGCAVFWRASKFRRVGAPMIVEFGQLALSRQDFEKCDTMFERFCAKDNVALGIVLEPCGNAGGKTNVSSEDETLDQAALDNYQRKLRRFFVCNVHIHWDPSHTDVKIVQSVMLMEEIERYLKKFAEKYPLSSSAAKEDSDSQRKLPTILCGDFNSLPNSLVYEFLNQPGGVRDVGKHIDLQECFDDENVNFEENDTGRRSSLSKNSGSTSSISMRPNSSHEDRPAAGEPQIQIRRWKSWAESGYGSISKSTVLKHLFSGTLASAYRGIEGVPIEGENVYMSPAHVISAISKGTSNISSQLMPPTYPVPALPFTNHTKNFTGVIDYVWFTSSDFDVSGVLGGYFLDGVGRDLVRMISDGERSESNAQAFQNSQFSANHRENTINGYKQTDTNAMGADGNEMPGMGAQEDDVNIPDFIKSARAHKSLLVPNSLLSPTSSHPDISGFRRRSSGFGGKIGSDSGAPKVWSIRSSNTVGFPNPVFPSDHIPVVVDLEWRKDLRLT